LMVLAYDLYNYKYIPNYLEKLYFLNSKIESKGEIYY
jgi:hypothetical protein